MGVGLMEGAKGVNFRVFGKQFVAWMGTLVIMGGGTALVFSQVSPAPGAQNAGPGDCCL